MIILITGASHTGKTAFAQKLLEKYKYPYLSIDHLKMGLIRSGHTSLTPYSSDRELTEYLWPIVSEIIKTAIENSQNLIVEGVYIPFNWQSSFEESYIQNIVYKCLIMSQDYIKNNFDKIKEFANTIENREFSDDFTLEEALEDNKNILNLCIENSIPYILIDKEYPKNIEI